MMKIKNLLAVVAHPDDLEMMAAGFVAKIMKDGANVHVLVLTNGSWIAPDGDIVRSKDQAATEMHNVSVFMNYSSWHMLNEATLDLNFKDALVTEVLKKIKQYNIDTLLTSWNKDSNRDHRIASEIALSASRRVPNFLMGQVNYYMLDVFTPNFYIDISDEWDKKIECMAKFVSQWERAHTDWTEFLDVISRYYGKIIGVERAEGFIAKRIAY
ncbi:MAG: PIG-L family deacetylase [Tenuifilaceae bacterium]|nr:PIG-L family deacetylase [Tenuifilaceae bacterium]